MQGYGVADCVNCMDRRAAGNVARNLANIANYLRDEECVRLAANAIWRINGDYNAAQELSGKLEDVAENMRNPADEMHISWNPITKENKDVFLKEIKSALDKKLIRQ